MNKATEPASRSHGFSTGNQEANQGINSRSKRGARAVKKAATRRGSDKPEEQQPTPLLANSAPDELSVVDFLEAVHTDHQVLRVFRQIFLESLLVLFQIAVVDNFCIFRISDHIGTCYIAVINDLLDPAGQNLRIREDSQGTYVEGIKEEVVLSPAHALSLIASGEEHRHVGSNNFNLLSSRSHTIFTLTIESSPSDENSGDEDVTLSQLNLIDLAGSESSKAETTGLRRKEGSYINKSLLTLGTVISKLTDDKATHIPYRDSKLTRLLQSSLSGHGRISLICTVTPASSNSEETHNTLKFAHRSKHVEIKASQNKIMDEKSLIKKYQREISCLKEELQQLKCGMMEKHCSYDQEDIVSLKLQLEAGQVKLLSRLEEEEEAKAALMGRIQRLTKLILVSTKNSLPSQVADKGAHRRRHSFGEDELAYLPDRKREYIIDDDAGSIDSELSGEGRFGINCLDDNLKFEKKNRRRGMLGWFKLKKPEYLQGLSPNADCESSASGSPLRVSQQKISSDLTDARRNSISRKSDDISLLNYFPEKTPAGDLLSATAKGRQPPPVRHPFSLLLFGIDD
ncbi:kinesin-like protein KIN-7E, chloroplastic [Dendrobium catenatum]|uniref:kinesin-like protein KIN-7E, chloroplastic n=1 Tax=Dendrobium catenatum TaxID=906689 RepID=UPI0010A08D46|nr:kinesin-like protein KIN-7E, chloroplastic [Dendrobium catenatum]